MKRQSSDFWRATRGVVIAPLPYTVGALLISGTVVAAYWLATRWGPAWFRAGVIVIVATTQFAELIRFWVRQAREVAEDIERLTESFIRIRKLRDEL